MITLFPTCVPAQIATSMLIRVTARRSIAVAVVAVVKCAAWTRLLRLREVMSVVRIARPPVAEMAPFSGGVDIGNDWQMHTVTETIGFFSVFLLMSVGFFLVGIYTIRKPGSTAKFFHGFGSQMYGKRISDRVYTSKNVLWFAWPCVIFTPFSAALAIYQITHAIVTGVGS